MTQQNIIVVFISIGLIFLAILILNSFSNKVLIESEKTILSENYILNPDFALNRSGNSLIPTNWFYTSNIHLFENNFSSFDFQTFNTSIFNRTNEKLFFNLGVEPYISSACIEGLSPTIKSHNFTTNNTKMHILEFDVEGNLIYNESRAICGEGINTAFEMIQIKMYDTGSPISDDYSVFLANNSSNNGIALKSTFNFTNTQFNSLGNNKYHFSGEFTTRNIGIMQIILQDISASHDINSFVSFDNFSVQEKIPVTEILFVTEPESVADLIGLFMFMVALALIFMALPIKRF